MTYIYRGYEGLYVLPRAYVKDNEVFMKARWYYHNGLHSWHRESTGLKEIGIEYVLPDEFFMEVA